MLVSPGIDAALAGVLGLLVGSFLNVVIYRLPKMLERQWAAECAELAGKPPRRRRAEFNLVVPRSRCRQCGHVIRWYENIPVLSYLALRGKCSACGTPIGLRYPLVELATGALFFVLRLALGRYARRRWPGARSRRRIVALALIDWDTTLLPDDITLPLLWAGLIAAALAGPTCRWRTPSGAPWRATCRSGLIYQAFKLPPARKAWATATSSCSPRSAPGSAGRRWCRSS